MPRSDTQRLLRHARQQIDEWDIGIRSDEFVCHLCLRVLPVAHATTGHYPSRRAGGGQHALQCADCNARLGWDIEDEAARFLTGDEWEMTVGPPGTTGVRMPVQLDVGGPALNLKTKSAAGAWQTIRELSARSSRPDVLECRMERPHPDALRMALLAWSFCEWSNYSSYAYTASAGAMIVRRMLLDGSVPIPTAAVVVFEDPLNPPLGSPCPMLVVHAENDVRGPTDIDEVLGIGVAWGETVVGILPAATDADGRVYGRLEELHAAGRRIQYLDLPVMLSPLGFKRMDNVLVITDDDGARIGITDWLSSEEKGQLRRDEHPRRLSPRTGARREYPEGHVEQFFMVEDTLRRYAPLPKMRQKKRKKGHEVMQPIGRTAVRDDDAGPWHIATHIRRHDGRPRGYAVFCGGKVKFDGSTQRIFAGTMSVCARCVTVMEIVPAELRPRPPAA